jgi:thioredoxin reductase (NADPH)
MRETEVLIIGQGPAGLSAAIYTGRAGIGTMILGCDPKIAGDYTIDNYFGFQDTISGRELIERGVRQAARFGVGMECDRVLSIHFSDTGGYVIKAESGLEIKALSVILATGVSRNRPNIEGLEKYEGRGVSYCVSCDGFFFRNRQVMVMGEGVYAANQALELYEYSPNVAICTGEKPSTISEEFSSRLRERGIQVLEDRIISLHGEPSLEEIVFKNGTRRHVDGIFIAMGDASSVDFARGLGVFTQGNFIQVDRDMKTNAPGVFAAGDCTGGFLQISKAVGEGAIAGHSAISYVRESREK